MNFEHLALSLKIIGAAVSLVSGMTAIFNVTMNQGRLTSWGWTVLCAVFLGFGFTVAGLVIDAHVKESEDAAVRNQNEATSAQLASIKRAAQSTIYPTTVGGSVEATISIDKSLPALKSVIPKLEKALSYAIEHCRTPGGVANCRDYAIRSVIVDEIRFDEKSSLFPRATDNFEANGILGNLSAVVWFFNKPFSKPSDLSDGSVGGILLDRKVLHASTEFEWDGARLRIFINAKVPPEAFETAGILSIVDLLGGSACARPAVRGEQICPASSFEHDCDLRLTATLEATKIELIEFAFPHRKNIVVGASADASGVDGFGIPYVFVNFPNDLDQFKRL